MINRNYNIGESVWATTHAVVSWDRTMPKAKCDLKRKITPILHKMVNNFFTPELVYLKEAWMEGADGKMELFQDVLSIRLKRFGSKEALLYTLKDNLANYPEVYKEIETHLLINDNIPDHYRYFLTLSSPETLKNGSIGFRNDFDVEKITNITLENSHEKKAKIKAGFNNVKNGDEYARMNSFLVDIIAVAKSKLAGSTESGIVSIKENVSFDGPEKYHSEVIQSQTVTPWEDFRTKHCANGIKFKSTIEIILVGEDFYDEPSKQILTVRKQLYIVRFNHGDVSDTNSYIVVRKAKLGEISQSHDLPALLAKRMENDLKKMEIYSETTSPDVINNGMLSTFLFGLISNDLGLIDREIELKNASALLSKFGKYKQNQCGNFDFNLKFKGKQNCYTKMISNFEALWKEILKPKNLKKFYDLEYPLWQNNRVLFIREEDPFEQFFAYGDEIQSPCVNTSLTNIKLNEIGRRQEVVKPEIAPGRNESLNPAKRGIDPLKK